MQPIQIDQRRAAFWSKAIQTMLVVSGLAIACSALPLTHQMKDFKMRQSVRAACGVIGLALCFVAEAERQDKKWSRVASEKIDEAIAYNQAAWVHHMTRPSQTSMRQIDAQTIEPELVPLFDWTELADPDEHPTFAIISPMGGGKSRLAKFLAKYVLFPNEEPRISAIDIYGRPKDWNDAELVTDHNAMLEFMADDLDEIESRVQLYRTGKDDFQPIFTILEEAPDTLQTLTRMDGGKDLVQLWTTKRTTVARKVKSRLCLVSVRLSGAEIGVSAEARNDATVIFPGTKGIAKAMSDNRIFKLGAKQNSELRSRLKASLNGVSRPALVYSDGEWHPALIPELDSEGNPSAYQPAMQTTPSDTIALPPSNEPDARSYLERAYDLEFNLDKRDKTLDELKQELDDLGTVQEPEWMDQIRKLKAVHKEFFEPLCTAIVKLTKESDEPIKARHVHQKFTSLKRFSPEDIRTVFLLLESFDKVRTVGEGDQMGVTRP